MRLRTMRLVVVVGLSALVLQIAATAQARPAAAKTPGPPVPYVILLETNPDGSCDPAAAEPKPAQLGNNASWVNQYGADVTVTERNGFWSVPVPKGATRDLEMTDAGTFLEDCGAGPETLAVAVKARRFPLGASFRVRWALPGGLTGLRYEVQDKTKGGAVTTWFANTSARSAVFTGAAGETYSFRALTILDPSHQSGFSPWRRVEVPSAS